MNNEKTARQWAVNDRLSLAEAAKLIVERDRKKSESVRAATDRVRHRITRAARNGKLNCADGKYMLGDLVAWARRQRGWRDKFDDLHASGSLASLSGGVTQGAQRVSGGLILIPESVEACAALIIKLQAENDTLQNRVKVLLDEIKALHDAEIKRKAVNAKKGKRTNKM